MSSMWSRGLRAMVMRWGLIPLLVMIAAPMPSAILGAQGGPNDPPEATVSPNDPNDPNDPDNPNGPPPTPTSQSSEPTEIPTAEETIPPPDVPLPEPPDPEATVDPGGRPVPDRPVLDLPVTGAPKPITMMATLRLRALVCPGDGFDPYLQSANQQKEKVCTGTAPFIFGVTMNRTAPASSSSRLLTVAAGAVGETTVDAPATLAIQHLAGGFGAHMLSCQSSVNGMVWEPLIVEPGEVIECVWYAMPLDDDVTIDGWVGVCEAAPDLSPTSPKPSAERLGELCHASVVPGIPVEIALANPDGTVKQVTTTSGRPWSASHEREEFVLYDLPPGTYTVTMAVPAGYRFAFVDSCAGAMGADPPIGVPVTGGSSAFTINATPGGRTFHCRWYLVRSS